MQTERKHPTDRIDPSVSFRIEGCGPDDYAHYRFDYEHEANLFLIEKRKQFPKTWYRLLTIRSYVDSIR